MKLLSRIKQDVATLKTLSGPRKREFIWDYYKLPIGVVLCAVALVVMTLTFDFSRGDIVMYAVLINADDHGGQNGVFPGAGGIRHGYDRQGRGCDRQLHPAL